MTEKSISPQTEAPMPERATPAATAAQRDIKSDDHGAFRVHVQLLGHEWSQTH